MFCLMFNNPTTIVFIDESGLTRDPRQPELAVGALIVWRNHLIIHQKLRNVFLGAVAKLDATEELFEFKFTYVTPNSLPFYKKLFVIMEEYRDDWTFVWTVAERGNNNFWNQYLELCLRITNFLPDRMILLADHLNKPKKSANGLGSLENEKVIKVLQLESQGTVFLQLADVLLGALMFQRKNGKDRFKAEVAVRAIELLNKKGAGIDPIYAAPNEANPSKTSP